MKSRWHELVMRLVNQPECLTDAEKVAIAAVQRLTYADQGQRAMHQVYEELLGSYPAMRRVSAGEPIDKQVFLGEMRDIRPDADELELDAMWHRMCGDAESMKMFVEAFRLRRMVM